MSAHIFAALALAGVPVVLGSVVLKGAGHKYIRREPKPGGGYKYFYNTNTEGALSLDVKPGQVLKIAHDGKKGHFKVDAVDGDKITMTHDESGTTVKVTRAELAKVLHTEHKAALRAKQKRHEAAGGHGAAKAASAKAAKRAREARRKLIMARRKASLEARKKQPAHDHRVDLKIASAAEVQTVATFTTRSAAVSAARAIGWSGAHVARVGGARKRKIHLGGGAWVHPWCLVDGDRQALTHDALDALTDMKPKDRPKPAPVVAERAQPQRQRDVDDLPARGAGGYNKVVDTLLSANNIDPGTVDTGTSDVFEHFHDGHEGVLPEAQLKKILAAPSGNHKDNTLHRLLVETLRKLKPQSWRDLVRPSPSLKNQSFINYLQDLSEATHGELPKSFSLPGAVASRHHKEDRILHELEANVPDDLLDEIKTAYAKQIGDEHDDKDDLSESELASDRFMGFLDAQLKAWAEQSRQDDELSEEEREAEEEWARGGGDDWSPYADMDDEDQAYYREAVERSMTAPSRRGPRLMLSPFMVPPPLQKSLREHEISSYAFAALALSGVPVVLGDVVLKGAGHKYIRREPLPGGKGYRYFYNTNTEGALKIAFKVGEALLIAHDGKRGHFHIKSVDGDKIIIEHDETKTKFPVTRAELERMVYQQHKAGLRAKQKQHEASGGHGAAGAASKRAAKRAREVRAEQVRRQRAQGLTGRTGKKPAARPDPASEQPEDIKINQDIRALEAAYRKASGGDLGQRVRIADIRGKSGLSREEEDAALREAFDRGRISVYPEDDRRRMTPEDEAAAFVQSGVAKHVLYWESPEPEPEPPPKPAAQPEEGAAAEARAFLGGLRGLRTSDIDTKLLLHSYAGIKEFVRDLNVDETASQKVLQTIRSIINDQKMKELSVAQLTQDYINAFVEAFMAAKPVKRRGLKGKARSVAVSAWRLSGIARDADRYSGINETLSEVRPFLKLSDTDLALRSKEAYGAHNAYSELKEQIEDLGVSQSTKKRVTQKIRQLVIDPALSKKAGSDEFHSVFMERLTPDIQLAPESLRRLSGSAAYLAGLKKKANAAARTASVMAELTDFLGFDSSGLPPGAARVVRSSYKIIKRAIGEMNITAPERAGVMNSVRKLISDHDLLTTAWVGDEDEFSSAFAERLRSEIPSKGPSVDDGIQEIRNAAYGMASVKVNRDPVARAEAEQRGGDRRKAKVERHVAEQKEKRAAIEDAARRSGFPLEMAERAYGGISWDPRGRAEQDLSGFLQTHESIRAKYEPMADTPEKKQALAEALERYKQGDLKRITALLSTKSRMLSSAIVGPAGFPARRQREIHDLAHNREGEIYAYRKKGDLMMRRAVGLTGGIRSDDSSATGKLREKIQNLKRDHEEMKAANKIYRDKKMSREEKIEALAKLGDDASVLDAPRAPYPGWKLSNLSAEIRRNKQRITDLEREAARAAERSNQGAAEGGRHGTVLGASFVSRENPDDSRLELEFSGKPSAEVRQKLKRNGFRWARSKGVWQRLNNPRARAALDMMMDEKPAGGEPPLSKSLYEQPISAYAFAALALAGVPVVLGSVVLKGAGHKYIRREKLANGRYRYWYNTGAPGALSTSMKPGDAIQLTHHWTEDGTGRHSRRGHFHVDAVNGDRVTMTHDATKTTVTVTKQELARMLTQEHGAGLRAAARAGGKAARATRRDLVVNARTAGRTRLERIDGLSAKTPFSRRMTPGTAEYRAAKWEETTPPGMKVAQLEGGAGRRGGTEEMHWDATHGDYTEERKQLHGSIVAGFFEGKQPPSGEPPEAIVMIGGTASGKSTILRNSKLGGPDYVHVDADDIKDKLPEYAELIRVKHKDAAGLAHEESSMLAKRVAAQAIEGGFNVVLDGTGGNKGKMLRQIEALRAAGFKITLMMPDQDKGVALVDAKGRAEKTGRWVPNKFIHAVYDAVPQVFLDLLPHVDEAHLFDRRQDGKRILEKRADGAVIEYDARAMSDFRSRAERTPR